MRPAYSPKTIVGSLAVLACLALSSPGVRVARADSERDSEALRRFLEQIQTAPANEAGVCRAGQSEARSKAQSEAQILAGDHQLVRLQQRMAARAAADAERRGQAPSGQIVLNGRGYNYGAPAAAIDPARLQQELRSLT